MGAQTKKPFRRGGGQSISEGRRGFLHSRTGGRPRLVRIASHLKVEETSLPAKEEEEISERERTQQRRGASDLAQGGKKAAGGKLSKGWGGGGLTVPTGEKPEFEKRARLEKKKSI